MNPKVDFRTVSRKLDNGTFPASVQIKRIENCDQEVYRIRLVETSVPSSWNSLFFFRIVFEHIFSYLPVYHVISDHAGRHSARLLADGRYTLFLLQLSKRVGSLLHSPLRISRGGGNQLCNHDCNTNKNIPSRKKQHLVRFKLGRRTLVGYSYRTVQFSSNPDRARRWEFPSTNDYFFCF